MENKRNHITEIKPEEKNACCMEADQTEVSSSGQPGTTLVSIDMNAEKGVIIRRVLRNIIHGKRKGKAELIETTKTVDESKPTTSGNNEMLGKLPGNEGSARTRILKRKRSP